MFLCLCYPYIIESTNSSNGWPADSHMAVLRYCDAGSSMTSASHSAPSLPDDHGEVWRAVWTPVWHLTLTHIEVPIALVAVQYLQAGNHPEGSHEIIP